jgi:hypothetical protein
MRPWSTGIPACAAAAGLAAKIFLARSSRMPAKAAFRRAPFVSRTFFVLAMVKASTHEQVDQERRVLFVVEFRH